MASLSPIRSICRTRTLTKKRRSNGILWLWWENKKPQSPRVAIWLFAGKRPGRPYLAFWPVCVGSRAADRAATRYTRHFSYWTLPAAAATTHIHTFDNLRDKKQRNKDRLILACSRQINRSPLLWEPCILATLATTMIRRALYRSHVWGC